MRSEAAMTREPLRLLRPGDPDPRLERARAERRARRPLAVVVLSVAALTLLGLVMVLSASSVSAFARYGSSFVFFERQAIYAAMGTVAAVACSRLPYRVWQRAWAPLLGITLVLLILVMHPRIGTTSGGASRWIDLGFFSMQPSEMAKFVVIAAVASVMARNVKHLDEPLRWVVPVLGILGPVLLLILFQRDMGTMAIIALSVFVVLFAAGVSMRVLAASFLLSAFAGTALIMGEGYRKTRLLAFIHPSADPLNAGYQIRQGLIALGSGHLLGVGLGASRQKWMYVPNAHTDFIFSILGEELGLIGALAVVALFAAIVYAGVRIALRAPDGFGRLLAIGIVGWLGIQALVNMGATTGIMPITGVPLPFLSFGGSSLIVSLAAIGVLLSIGRAGAQAAGRGGRGARRRRPGRVRVHVSSRSPR